MSIKADDLTIPGRLRILAAERGEQVAMKVLPDGGELTFRTWDQRSDAAAGGLAALGVKPGDTVLLPVAADWVGYAIAYAAIHKSGATAVPVLASHSAEHVRWAHASAATVGVISDQAFPGCAGWTRSLTDLENGLKSPPDLTISRHDDAQIIFTSGTTGWPKGRRRDPREHIALAVRAAPRRREDRAPLGAWRDQCRAGAAGAGAR